MGSQERNCGRRLSLGAGSGPPPRRPAGSDPFQQTSFWVPERIELTHQVRLHPAGVCLRHYHLPDSAGRSGRLGWGTSGPNQPRGGGGTVYLLVAMRAAGNEDGFIAVETFGDRSGWGAGFKEDSLCRWERPRFVFSACVFSLKPYMHRKEISLAEPP